MSSSRSDRKTELHIISLNSEYFPVHQIYFDLLKDCFLQIEDKTLGTRISF